MVNLVFGKHNSPIIIDGLFKYSFNCGQTKLVLKKLKKNRNEYF